MTKNDNGNGNKVLCKVRKEWQRMAMAKVQSAEELRVFRET